ncbi:MAG: S8 family serine peptidase [Verrucomicrobiae bacterium]|nr:S8 family serine peptidase [Verrucomicrobiae bacterium]
MNSRVFLIPAFVVCLVLTAVGILLLQRFDPEGSAVSGTGKAVQSDLPAGESRVPERESVPAYEPEMAAEAAETEVETPEPESASELTLENLRKKLVRVGAWENEALLSFADAKSLADFIALAKSLGIEISGPFGDALTIRARFDSLETLYDLLKSSGLGLPFVDPNFFVTIPRITPPEEAAGEGKAPFDDMLFKSLGIPDDADRSAWGTGVTVAVIDSGISDHPTFREGQVTRIDLVGEDVPLHGHGTAMASLIAGREGIAPGAKLVDIRIAGENGLSDSFLLAQGLQTAIDRGADVVNISLGTYGNAPLVQTLVAEAQKKGLLIVAPVGNENVELKAWPAAYPGVISVSGVDANDQIAYFSNTGGPTLAAPAVGIISAYYAEQKALLIHGNGTSQAAALVSGSMALMKSRGLNPTRALTSNARYVRGGKVNYGAGVLHLPVSVTR